MKRKKDAPGLELYYKAQEEIFLMQSTIMTGVLTHYGERGRNDEELLREFLRKILPRIFTIGTGFIVSSNREKKQSAQTDIIIHDQFWNSPLYKELAAEVYPVETVYATIEVKSLLAKAPKGKERKSDLDRALESIAQVRDLAKDKKYVQYVGRPKSNDQPDKLVAHPAYFSITLPPRAYIFSFAKKGWRDLKAFKEHLKEKLKEHSRAHLHGIVVLEKNWFVFQEAHTGEDVLLHGFDNNCLLRFANALLRGIHSIPMGVASIDDYHRAGLYKSVCAGHPSESYFDGDPEPSYASDEDE